MGRIPVTIVTGFLGSGKTTLLTKLLTQREFADAALVVNEAGPIGIDQLLLDDPRRAITQLVNGCFCCVSRSDFAETFRSLLLDRAAGRVPNFSQVVVETTGLADPSELLKELLKDGLLASRFSVRRTITVVDARHGLQILETRSEAVSQVALADQIVLTKRDIANAEPSGLLQQIDRIAPGVPILNAKFGDLEASELIRKTPDVAWARDEETKALSPNSKNTSHHHSGGIDVFALHSKEVLASAEILAFFESIKALGPKLLRVKGLIHVRERASAVGIVNGVHGYYHPVEWRTAFTQEGRKTQLVFITSNLARCEIESIWQQRTTSNGNVPCKAPTLYYATAIF